MPLFKDILIRFCHIFNFYRTTMINLYEFLENPEKYWLEVNKDTQKSPPEPTLFDIIW